MKRVFGCLVAAGCLAVPAAAQEGGDCTAGCAGIDLLTIRPAYTSFSQNRMEWEVAGALDQARGGASGALGQLITTIDTMPGDSDRRALLSRAGNPMAPGMAEITTQLAGGQAGIIARRIDERLGAAQPDFAFGGFGLGLAGEGVGPQLLDLSLLAPVGGGPPPAPDAGGGRDLPGLDGVRGFIGKADSLGEARGGANSAGYDYEGDSRTLGLDWSPAPHTLLGIAGGRNRFTAELDDGRGTLSGRALGLTLYGGRRWDRLSLSGQAGYALLSFDENREVPLSTGQMTAEGDTEGQQMSAHLRAAWQEHAGEYDWGPFGQVSWRAIAIDGYQEDGAGTAGLDVGAQSASSTAIRLGVQAHRRWIVEGAQWEGFLSLAGEQQINRGDEAVTAAFLGGGAFSTPVDRSDPMQALISAGVAASLTDGASLRFSYEGVVGDGNLSAHALLTRFRMDF